MEELQKIKRELAIIEWNNNLNFDKLYKMFEELEQALQLLQTDVSGELFCKTCHSEVTYWADLDRWTCLCGRKTK